MTDTSLEAHRSIVSSAEIMRTQIVERYAAAAGNGMTCDEIEVELNMRHQTASARISELKKAGRLVDSGLRRDTRSGRAAAVLLLAA